MVQGCSFLEIVLGINVLILILVGMNRLRVKFGDVVSLLNNLGNIVNKGRE